MTTDFTTAAVDYYQPGWTIILVTLFDIDYRYICYYINMTSSGSINEDK